jgi:hypothetical protein
MDRSDIGESSQRLLGTLAEMRDPLHPWRVELRKTVDKLIAELATDPQMRARAGRKAELLASPLLIEQAKTLWAEPTRSGLPAHSKAIGCARALRNAGTCAEDEERKHRSTGGSGLSASGFYCPIASRSAPYRARGAQLGQATRSTG